MNFQEFSENKDRILSVSPFVIAKEVEIVDSEAKFNILKEKFTSFFSNSVDRSIELLHKNVLEHHNNLKPIRYIQTMTDTDYVIYPDAEDDEFELLPDEIDIEELKEWLSDPRGEVESWSRVMIKRLVKGL